MTPLVLEGATLGKRHQHYNSLLKTAVSSDKLQPAKIDYEKTDIENLFNIDIASHNKDVEYILDILKGDDLLYVSRAIKRSNWLINDDQFAHIIEPQYLHSELFPQMMPKASCKFLLHIRLTLKKESRVARFFQYFRQKDLKTALKWLPNCPVSVIEEVIEKHAREISPNAFKRLCERSSTILDVFVKSHDGYKSKELKAAMILLHSNPEMYMDAIKNVRRLYLPVFGKKETKIIMKKCPHRLIDNFEKYMYNIDLDTFAKYMKKNEIESFILNQLEDKDVKPHFNDEKIIHFVKYMPKESKYEFIKRFTVRKTDTQIDECDIPLKCSISAAYVGSSGRTSNSAASRWYKYVPFEVAFTDLKKMIDTEYNLDAIKDMLKILVITARKNLENINSLLQYYREKHINQPFRLKIQFVNDLLDKTDPHLYDNKTWSLLDDIFRSMEVYVESNNNVQTCLKAIIVRKVLRGETVPDIVEQKFVSDTLKPIQRKLNGEQKVKVFKYLYDYFFNKLNSLNISSNDELAEYVELFQKGLHFLKDWNKKLADFPDLINKIKDCAQIKREKRWAASLTPLYDTDKSWRKHLFEYSLILSPSQNVCMNALKHDPKLLTRHKDELGSIRFNDAISMTQVLRKLRIYWTHTIAAEWVSAYRERLDKRTELKAVVCGLCCLLNQKQLSDFLKKHEPRETKINWANADKLELSLCKNVAQSMHVARPQIKPEAVLAYAKGDYVQFTQPSLNAILYNIKSKDSREHVLNLLNGSTFLQKRGVFFAFTKLPTADIKQICLDVWKSNKKPSVRTALFRNTHELLCTEQDEARVASLWELMEIFIDSLKTEESKAILNTFSTLSKVHPSIQLPYTMKSYSFLRSLNQKEGLYNYIQRLKEETMAVIEYLDPNIIADRISKFVDSFFFTEICDYPHSHEMQLIAYYLLNADDESSQLERYEKVMVPLIEKSYASWNKIDNRYCGHVRINLYQVFENMYRATIHYAFKKNKAKSVTLYKNILAKLESYLKINRYYNRFTQLKLTIGFIETLLKNNNGPDTVKNWISDEDVEKQYLAIASDFGEVVAQYLKEDVEFYGVHVCGMFATALMELQDTFNISKTVKIRYFKSWLGDKEFVAMYLLVIRMLDTYYYDNDPKEDLKEIHKMLMAHPRAEVQISYYYKFGENPMPYL